MRLLITGGCGFVGSNFIRYVLQHYGPEMVTNVDSLTTGRLENVEGVAETYGERYEFLHASVDDPDRIDAMLATHQFFAIIHFAAESAGVAGTAVLLEQARRHGVRRFILASREGGDGVLEAVESIALAAHRDHGQEVVVARATEGYGPYQPPAGFIPATIVQALRDQPVPLEGDGSRSRDWLHVEDYCAGVFIALLDGIPGTVHHFASGHRMRDLDLVQRILEHLGRSGDLLQMHAGTGGSPPDFVPRPADRAALDSLAWKPRQGLEEGLRATIDWYVRNREWWEPAPVR